MGHRSHSQSVPFEDFHFIDISRFRDAHRARDTALLAY